MLKNNDKILEIKWSMSYLLTLMLDAQDRGMDIEKIENELIIDTDEYYTLKDNLKYFSEEELDMVAWNIDYDINYLTMLLRKVA